MRLLGGHRPRRADSQPSERVEVGNPPALARSAHGPREDGAEDVSSRISGKGTLIGTFIADQKHPFFEGDGFNAVLPAVQAQPRRFKVYEKAGTLRISVQDVKNMQAAKEAMKSVVGVAA